MEPKKEAEDKKRQYNLFNADCLSPKLPPHTSKT